MRDAEKAEAMTSRDKVLDVERQVFAIVQNGPASFECPFCGLTTDPDQSVVCCDAAAYVIGAILDHLEFLKSVDLAEKAMNRLADLEARERANLICLN